MEESQKISLVETILMLMIVVPVDLLEVIVVFISPVPVIGQIAMAIMPFIGLVVLFVIQFWLMMKGLSGLWALTGNVLDLIPFANALPSRTLGVIATIILANRPETAKIAKIAGAATGKIGK